MKLRFYSDRRRDGRLDLLEVDRFFGYDCGRFTDLEMLGSDATLQEALDYGYVTGKKSSLAAVAEGVLKAMIDGIKKDGNGRKIDDFVSINAFPRGSLKDICDELVKQNVKVSVRARMLKEFKVDTKEWSFIIEGSTGSFAIEVVTTGEKLGEYKVGELGHLNGKDLPSTAAAEWRVASGQMTDGFFAVGFADWSDLESGDYPDCRMKLVHPSGDIIVPFKASKL